jgi:ribosomal protein S18 acetylase RimI-like enzyme
LKVELKEVLSKSDLRKFIEFPLELYKDCPYFVPPFYKDEFETFLPRKNPAFEFCSVKQWLAFNGKNVVGRIAGIINHKFNELWRQKAIRFGWIDFIDNENVSKILIEKVAQWGRKNKLEYIHGPLGFSDMDYEGMLVEGFEEEGTLATIYNYSYYPVHLERLDFEKEVDWVEFEIKVPTEIPERAERIAKIVSEKLNLKILEAKSRKELLPYANDLFSTLNAAYKNLFGFVPLTEKQIKKYIKQYLSFVLPDYVKLVLDSEDKVAGFVIGLPSLSEALKKTGGKLFPFGFLEIMRALGKKNKKIDLYVGAIRPDLQGRGADALLMVELTKSCIKNKVISAETNIELETNTLVQGHWKYFDSRQHKRRRCFKKSLKDFLN